MIEFLLIIVGCVIFSGVFILIVVLMEEEFKDYGIIFEFWEFVKGFIIWMFCDFFLEEFSCKFFNY